MFIYPDAGHEEFVTLKNEKCGYKRLYTERRSASETAIEFLLFIILIALNPLTNPNA